MEPESSLPHLQEPATCLSAEVKKNVQRISPAPRQMYAFRNKDSFYGEELLSPRPTPKLEDHPLSAVRDRLSIDPQLSSTLEAVPPSASWGRAMPWWQGPTGSLREYITVLLLKSKGKWEYFSVLNVGTERSGARGSAVGWDTALQVGRSRVRFPMVSLEFFIDIILLAALWSWGRLSL